MTFQASDLLAEVRELTAPNDSPPRFYIALETSYTAGLEDAQKATDHSQIVRAVTGISAYPVVAAILVAEITERL